LFYELIVVLHHPVKYCQTWLSMGLDWRWTFYSCAPMQSSTWF